MFRIADGREHFYQWDLDRQIIVEDSSITEVHFCNRTDDCSLVVDVIDGLANVPNVILQKSFDIRVFGYDGKATRYDEAFKVKARTKPTDYVYTEVEIKRYEDLEKRLDEIEEKGFSEEVVDNAVNSYFEKNPISFDGYATEAYVDNAIENIDIPEVDLSKHALKSEIPTKVSQLQNDSKFITRDEVPQTDLSEYAKKSEIPDVSKFLTSVPSEYITESELNAKNYLTSVPSHYITESNLNSRDYVTESELNSKGYATEKYVDDAIANAQLEGEDIDLSEYAKKEDIPDVSDFISEIPSEYITESELNAKGYLTEHQSLAEYAKKSELFSKDYNDLTNKPTIPSTEGLATEKYVDDAIAGIEIPETGPYVFTIKIENDSIVNTPAELNLLREKVIAGERVLCYWSCSEGIYHTKVSISSIGVVLVSPSFAYVNNKEVKLIPGQVNLQASGTHVYLKHINADTAPTVAKVEEMIAAALSGIATAEGGAY